MVAQQLVPIQPLPAVLVAGLPEPALAPQPVQLPVVPLPAVPHEGLPRPVGVPTVPLAWGPAPADGSQSTRQSQRIHLGIGGVFRLAVDWRLSPCVLHLCAKVFPQLLQSRNRERSVKTCVVAICDTRDVQTSLNSLIVPRHCCCSVPQPVVVHWCSAFFLESLMFPLDVLDLGALAVVCIAARNVNDAVLLAATALARLPIPPRVSGAELGNISTKILLSHNWAIEVSGPHRTSLWTRTLSLHLD